MYEYSLAGRAEEIAGRPAGHDGHRQDLRQGADGQQNHGVYVAHRFDQGGADGEESTWQKCQEHPVPLGPISIGLAIIGELLGIVIGRVDAVVGSRGLYAELHRDISGAPRREYATRSADDRHLTQAILSSSARRRICDSVHSQLA